MKSIEAFCKASRFAALHIESGLISAEALIDSASHTRDVDAHASALGAFADEDIERWMAEIRQYRHREMLRIAYRDFCAMGDLDSCLFDISDLAQALVTAARDYAASQMIQAHGALQNDAEQTAAMLVIGMGKLGGRELNFSSDIDLIFFYEAVGQSDGRRTLDAHSYMVKLGQLVVRLLGEHTAQGRAYDVDMRLRPFGRSGPLAMSIDAAANYYQTQGREWERYAMQKARMLCGDDQDWDAVHQWLRPFVYRRYLDYGVIDSLRALKLQIREGCPDADNIKLGPGGIRTAEFLVHSMALIRGGRETDLQCTNFFELLQAIKARGLFDLGECEQIEAAYRLLRRVENSLQMQNDKPSHLLPQDDAARAVLANWVGYADWASLSQALEARRQALEAQFQALFRLDEDEADDPAQAAFDAVWQGNAPAQAFVETLRAAGLELDTTFAKALLEYRDSISYRALSETAQRRVDQSVLWVLRHSEDKATLRAQLFGFIRKMAGRSGYLQVLLDNPAAFLRVAAVFSRSQWLADLVTRSPLVIDELIHQTDPIEHSYSALNASVQNRTPLAALEVDEAMDALRAQKQGQTMRIALLDIDKILALRQVSDRLTWLAQSLFEMGMDYVQREFERKHGPVSGGGLLWVGYGKLGGIELGYASDLDMVALRQTGSAESSGDRPLDFVSWHIRLAQRMINFCDAPTILGKLYELDMRLRPDGESGPLVSSMDRYAQYLQDSAWTWELQALVRARPICGPKPMWASFSALRRSVLCQPRDRKTLAAEVRAMRQKMRDGLDKSDAEHFDLKHAVGGVVDVEFIVQYLVLAHSHAHPVLCDYTDNFHLLETAAQCGVISDAQSQRLEAAYSYYREYIHRLALKGRGGLVKADAPLQKYAASVLEIWSELLQP